MKARIITEPTELPITREQAKIHLRVPFTETTDDSYIDALIEAATQVVEQITNRKIITQTWERYFDGFPNLLGYALAIDSENMPAPTGFELPYSPLQSISSIKYYNPDGNLETLPTTVYQVDLYSAVGRVFLKANQTWPNTEEYRLNAVEVRFVCGYGSATAVPKAIRQAILLLVGTWYENRESVISGVSVAKVPDTIELLLQSYRVFYFQ